MHALSPNSSTETWLPSWSRRQFYRHGLLCASYSRTVLLLTALLVCLILRPLLSIPVYLDEVREEESSKCPTPKVYVLQILVQATVHPYPVSKMVASDAIRAPIASAFKLHLQDILPYRDPQTNASLDEYCVRTDGLGSHVSKLDALILSPSFGCLLLSPANLWGRDQSNFESDADVVSTVMNLHERREEGTTSSLMEMIFGIRQRETGINRVNRNRRRTIRYALTLALKEDNTQFVANLKRHLLKLYPLSDQHQVPDTDESENDETFKEDAQDVIVRLFFPLTSHLYDVLVFCGTISSLFLYMWITCKKIELVRSPLVVGVGAVVTSVTAILMAVSLSGLSINLDRGKMLFMPYILTFISLENVLVITRSIVETPAHLDARIRVAQGLSREGWTITKNLLLEVSLLALGFGSLYSAGVMDTSIKDFCTLTVLGLLSDFFLQLFFFTTVLACDMSNIELADDFNRSKSDSRMSRKRIFRRPQLGPGLRRTSSISNETSVMAPQCNYSKQNSNEGSNEPRRVRLMNFFASKRISQRLFVVTIIVWFAIFCYQTRYFEDALINDDYYYNRHDNNTRTTMPETSDDTAGKNGLENASNEFKNLKEWDVNRKEVQSKTSEKQGMKNLSNATLEDSDGRTARYSRSNSSSKGKIVNKSLNSFEFSRNSNGLVVNLSDIFIEPPSLNKAAIVTESSSGVGSNPILFMNGGKKNGLRYSWRRLPLSHWPRLFELYNLSLKRHCLAMLRPIELAIVIGPEGAIRLRHPKDLVAFDLESQEDNLTDDGIKQEVLMTEEAVHAFSDVVHEIGTIRLIPSTVGEVFLALAFVLPTLLFISYVVTVLYACITCRHYAQWRATREQKLNNIKDKPSPDPRTQIVQESLPITLAGHSLDIENVIVDPYSHIFVSHCLGGVINSWDAVTAENISTIKPSPSSCSSVWALDCCDLLLVTGCSDGSIQLYDTRTGEKKAVWQGCSSSAVNHIRFVSPRRLALTRIGGFLELLAIEETSSEKEREQLRLIQRLRAHASDIHCLVVGLNCIVTGSDDQTLRVFRLHTACFEAVYTLHGHCGSVTTAFVDDSLSADEHVVSAGSGSSDGMLCVWDLYTGACVYSLVAHEGAVINLTHSPSYVISLGEDCKICVWERKEGYLINTIALDEHGLGARELVMLSHNLVVSSGTNGLVVWDARLMEPVKEVRLVAPPFNQALGRSVKMVGQLGDTIVASIGNQLRLVHFPLLSDKSD